MVVESALEGELDDHLGYARNDPAGRDGGNSRNGHRAKTVLTDTGPVELSVPRDRDSNFEPAIVAKRQRRLTGVDDMVPAASFSTGAWTRPPGTTLRSPRLAPARRGASAPGTRGSTSRAGLTSTYPVPQATSA